MPVLACACPIKTYRVRLFGQGAERTAPNPGPAEHSRDFSRIEGRRASGNLGLGEDLEGLNWLGIQSYTVCRAAQAPELRG